MDYLVTRGYPRQYVSAVALHPADGPNVPAAAQIAHAVEQLLARANQAAAARNRPGRHLRVDIVSHSMGSVSARWYAARIGPERVRCWISLAGANHGTNDLCPYVGRDSGGAAELCPAYRGEPPTSIQVLLNGAPRVPDVDETPYGVGRDSPGVRRVAPEASRQIAYWTIRTEPDEWISPDDSVVLDGAGGFAVSVPAGIGAVETSPGNFLLHSRMGHGLPRDPAVMALVLEILRSCDANL